MSDTNIGLLHDRNDHHLIVAFERRLENKTIFRIEESWDGETIQENFDNEKELLEAFKNKV
jgi:hypothetical protein